MRRLLGYLGLSLMLASALLLGASQLLPRLDAARWEDAIKTTGQIVGFTQGVSSRRPLVSFVASDGDPYVFEADTYSSNMQQGQMVTVRYFLMPSLQASLKVDFGPIQLGLGIAGCALMAASLILLFLQMRKSSLRRQLIQYGTRLEATVLSVDLRNHITVNGRHPCIVTCTLHNPQGIGEWVVKSDCVWRLPPGLQIGSTVPVLVDLYSPSHYLVLTDEAPQSVHI